MKRLAVLFVLLAFVSADGKVARRVGMTVAPATADLLDETFNTAVGYDLTWTESNGAANINEDDATNPPVGAVTGFVTQDLKVTQAGSTRSNTWAALSSTKASGTVYARFYMYVLGSNIPDAGEYTDIFELNSPTATAFTDSSSSGPRIILKNVAGTLQLEFWVGSGGNASVKTISAGTGYRVEYAATIGSVGGGVVTISSYEWKVDGVLIGSGNGTFNDAGNAGIGRVICGVDQNGNATIYFDTVGVGSTGYIGA